MATQQGLQQQRTEDVVDTHVQGMGGALLGRRQVAALLKDFSFLLSRLFEYRSEFGERNGMWFWLTINLIHRTNDTFVQAIDGRVSEIGKHIRSEGFGSDLVAFGED
jgi:hypothetical protein